MIPIRLILQGLYSYQERQTIDFTKLTSANLFGIFGSVGSGKSTILEAITFALYGRTDRLNLSGDNRNYNMMNLKSNDLFIEFIFETGKDQTAYQAVVKGRRNGKKFEEVRTLDRTAYRQENGNWIPIEPESLETAIGLSYENFKRTIIIPQGQFQEFLQLGNKDRTQMMKELFNLERFELYYKVASLESRNNAQKQNLEGQLQQLGVVDPEQIKQYEAKLTQLNTELGHLARSLAENQKSEAELKQLSELVKKLTDTRVMMQQLKVMEPEFVTLESTIRNYEQCLIQFKSLLDSLAQSDKKIIQKNELIEKETVILNKAEAEISSSEATFTEIKKAYDQRDLLRQKADELVKIARLNVLQTSLLNDEERIRKGEIILVSTVEKIGKLKAEKESLELLLKNEKAKLPDLGLLSKVKTWHIENNNLIRQWTELKAETTKYQKEILSLSDALKVNFQEQLFSGLTNDADTSAGIQFLKEKMNQSKQQITQLEVEMAHYRVQSKLEEYAVNLHDSEACPLCGSIHHPSVFSAASVADASVQASKLKTKLEKEITLASEYINQISDLGNRLKFNKEQSSEWSLKLKDLDLKIANHALTFYWPDYKDEQSVNHAFFAAEVIQKVIKEKEKELQGIAIQQEKEIVNKEKFQAEIEKIRHLLISSQTEIKTLSEQIQLIRIDEYKLKPVAEIESEKLALLQKIITLEKQYNEIGDQLTGLRKTKDTVIGSLNANRKELVMETEVRVSVLDQLNARFKQSNFDSLEEVKEILKHEINLELQKQMLTDFRQQLSVTQNQVSQLQKEIANRSYDNEAHQKLVAEIAVISEQVSQKNQELGKIAELQKKLQTDLKNQSLIQKELYNVELRGENIKTLKALFKSSGFVNYISSVYLQNLCNVANDRFFQLTRQKLSLEITEDNSFQVRDYLNGGKVRSVKTLSGGQIFQAALSLALALADNIQKITDSNQNFFFLDEGFGSLDKDSLSVVFDTLKSLRKENRIVGVISHVEEMQQEIDTHLRIVNHEETGSLILTSWN